VRLPIKQAPPVYNKPKSQQQVNKINQFRNLVPHFVDDQMGYHSFASAWAKSPE
jgi:hypothetical protein